MKILILLLFFIIAVTGSLPVQASDFQSDWNYYQKVSKQKNLNANDRLYILYRLQQKHADTGEDTARLEREIARLKSGKQTPNPSISNSRLSAQIKNIDVRDEENMVTITVILSKPVTPHIAMVRNHDTSDKPVLTLDFPNTADSRSDQSSIEGAPEPVESIRLQPIENNLLRVEVFLMVDAPYRVKRQDKKIFIQLKKVTASQESELMNSGGGEEFVEVETETVPQADPVPSSSPSVHKIQAGDLLNIDVVPESFSRQIMVRPNNSFLFPLIGKVSTKDRANFEVANELQRRLAKYVSSPKVSISIEQFSQKNVYMMGETNQVGSFQYTPGLKLLEFISKAGGFKSNANRKEVKVYRGHSAERKTMLIDVEEIMRNGNFSKDVTLINGDIVEVGKTVNDVLVVGEVTDPGRYDFHQDLTLLEIVSLAGGPTSSALSRRTKIFRATEGEKRKIIRINLAKILRGHPENDVKVLPGDIVLVPSLPLTAGARFINENFLPWATLMSVLVSLAILI